MMPASLSHRCLIALEQGAWNSRMRSMRAARSWLALAFESRSASGSGELGSRDHDGGKGCVILASCAGTMPHRAILSCSQVRLELPETLSPTSETSTKNKKTDQRSQSAARERASFCEILRPARCHHQSCKRKRPERKSLLQNVQLQHHIDSLQGNMFQVSHLQKPPDIPKE